MRLFFTLLLLPYSLWATPSEETFQKIANSPSWHKQMHYKNNFWGGLTGQADGPKFYLSPNGKTDPLAELKESYYQLSQVKKTTNENLQLQCRYPSRFRFIKQAFGFDFKVDCPDLNQWVRSLDPSGLAIIYSAAYPNAPASTFGHTFLRIISKKSAGVQKAGQSDKKIDLLDYQIGFSAHTGEVGFISYVFNGLFGGFKGLYSLGPYYQKVNEYNNLESRDLWEYELNLNGEETKNLLLHLWEVGQNTYFDYFFLDENCSYQILTLIDVVKPNWNIAKLFRYYVVPAQTILPFVQNSGRVKKIKYRPSLYKRFKHQLAQLSQAQKQVYFKIINNNAVIDKISDPYPLEVAISHFSYLKKKDREKFMQEKQTLYTHLLIRRSQIDQQIKEKFDLVPRPAGPHQGHDDKSLEIKLGNYRSNSYTQLGFKFGLHDLMAVDFGYPQYSTIEGAYLRARLYKNKIKPNRQYQVDEIGILTISSLFPSSTGDQNMSYEVKTGFETLKDQGCITCLAYGLSGKVGWSTELTLSNNLFFILVGPRFEAHSSFGRGFRYGPEAKVGWHYRHDKHRSLLETLSFWDADQKRRPDITYQLHIIQSYNWQQNWEVRLDGRFYFPDQNIAKKRDLSIELRHYF